MSSSETDLMPIFTADQAIALVMALTQVHEITGRPPTSATLGSNIITNGTFASGLGNWTFTGWTWSAGTAVHTVGNTNALSQTISVSNGTLYLIQSTVLGSDPMAGTSNVYVDGTLCPGYNTVETAVPSTNYVAYLATSTGNVTFEIRPSTDFVSAYDNISMKPLTASANAILALTAYGESSPTLSFYGTFANGNLGIGYLALHDTVSGQNNVALGKRALSLNISGFENVAIGSNALGVNTVGFANMAVGFNALALNTGGFSNTAIGGSVLSNNTYGTYNTAIGLGAMTENVIGISNVAIGVNALYTATGNYNVGIGPNALGAARPNTCSHCISIGIDSSRSITSGRYNEAVGHEAQSSVTTGQGNDCVGHQALFANTTGDYNAGFGYQTLSNLASGSSNTALGASAGNGQTAGSGNIAIGASVNLLSTTGSNQLNIGNTIYGDLANDKIGIGRAPTAKFAVAGLVEYADNAAALLGGLTAGDFYRTVDVLKVVH